MNADSFQQSENRDGFACFCASNRTHVRGDAEQNAELVDEFWLNLESRAGLEGKRCKAGSIERSMWRPMEALLLV